jgi:hypothetical protein
LEYLTFYEFLNIFPYKAKYLPTKLKKFEKKINWKKSTPAVFSELLKCLQTSNHLFQIPIKESAHLKNILFKVK